MKKLDARLLRMIKNSKGQFISVVVIVVVALSIYISFSTTAININNAIDYYYDETKLSHIHVQLMKIPKGAVEEVKSIAGVTEAQGRVTFDVPLKTENKDEKVSIRMISIPTGGGSVNRLYSENLISDLTQEKDLILIQQFAQARNIKPGDMIEPYINGRIYNMKVSDIAASSEFVYLMENEQSLLPAPEKFGVAYVSEEFAQSVYGYKGSYNELLIRVKDEERIDDVVKVLEKKLDKYGVQRIIKREEQLSNNVLTQKLEGFDTMATAIPILFLAVAGIIISIMLSRIVSNDRMAIGVLKALGYSNMDVLFHYLKYALAIGLISSIIGIILGLFLAKLLTEVFILFFNIPLIKVDIQYIYIIYSIVLTSAFCIVSGFMGARHVLGIMPADSMRPEPPKAGKHILLERVGFIWGRLSFSWKIVIRNIMRTKRRFVLLMLGLALAYAINTVPLYMVSSMTSMFSIQFGQFEKMDYVVELSRPMNKNVMKDMAHLLQGAKLEPRLEFPFELKNAWRKKAVSVIGVPQDTQFYEFRDENNNKIALPKKGILLSEAMAKILNVKKGDYVTVSNFIPGKDDINLEVKGIVKQYLGANAYMNIEHMREALTEKNMITGVSALSKDDLKTKLEDVQNIASVKSVIDIKNSFEEYLDTIIYGTNL
ncbi:MAG: FtsX-like permease family protein, partial [Lutispora sp.]